MGMWLEGHHILKLFFCFYYTYLTRVFFTVCTDDVTVASSVQMVNWECVVDCAPRCLSEMFVTPVIL